jgi:hypothetical protein
MLFLYNDYSMELSIENIYLYCVRFIESSLNKHYEYSIYTVITKMIDDCFLNFDGIFKDTMVAYRYSIKNFFFWHVVVFEVYRDMKNFCQLMNIQLNAKKECLCCFHLQHVY